MKYISTKGSTRSVTLREALLRPLAPDGGIYMPVGIPTLPPAFFNNIGSMSFSDIAYVLANTLFGQDLDSGKIRSIVNDAFNFDVPLRKVDSDIYSIELYHGPTLSFKDFGARFLASAQRHVSKKGMPLNLIVATAGDSGGAMANAFCDIPGVSVYVVFPLHKMSRLQEAQFATLSGNVHALGVNGTFDDCQSMVKAMLADDSLSERLTLVSGNSLSVGRMLAQTFYYFAAYAALPRKVRESGRVVLSVPSGNLGNLTAAVIACRMGLPVSRLIAVNNTNDIFIKYLQTGVFTPRRSVRTIASSMDVGAPSNFERLLWLYGGSHERMSAEISGVSYTDREIAETMIAERTRSGYQLDPHAATAQRALEECLRPGETGIVVETACAAKFSDTVEAVTGRAVELPADVAATLRAPRHVERIAPNPEALRRYLLSQQNSRH